jgi:hypothetical protein
VVSIELKHLEASVGLFVDPPPADDTEGDEEEPGSFVALARPVD